MHGIFAARVVRLCNLFWFNFGQARSGHKIWGRIAPAPYGSAKNFGGS
jgi:hypothetical protein